MGRKFALLLGIRTYQDPKFQRLTKPDADARRLAAVLADPRIGGFDSVEISIDEDFATTSRKVGRLFADKRHDDLLLLYFAGHGIKDDHGHLHLATTDTDAGILAATALSADFLTSQMNRSRSRKQILILDCCFSGAFAGTRAPTSVGATSTFAGDGIGRVIFTATDSFQYAWENEEQLSETNSVFTHFLIEGLATGAADRDQDGIVTADEWYDYVYTRVREATPKQTPHVSVVGAGSVAIAYNPNIPFADRPTPVAAIPTFDQSSVKPRAAAWRWGGWAAAAALLLIVLTLVLWQSKRSGAPQHSAPETSSASVTLRRRAAIFGLHNESAQADTAWITTAVSELLARELGADGKILVTSAREVAAARADLGLHEPATITPQNLQRLRKRLGVDSVVLGKYATVGGPASSVLRLELTLLDAATGRVASFSSTSGTRTQLFDLVSRASVPLRQALGLGDLSDAHAVRIEAEVPTANALHLYSDGISRLATMDAAGARDLLSKAAQADPKNPLVQSALSEAYAALGYATKANDAAQQAVALSAGLEWEQRLRIQARAFETAKQWDKAVDAARRLWESFPDDVDYGVQLANAQIAAGKPQDALVTIERLRKLPIPASADGRIDLAEASAEYVRGNFQKQRASAQAAAAKGKALGSRLLIARARSKEASALIRLGDTTGATAALEEARSLFQATGDRRGVADAWELAAIALDQQGDLAGSRRLLQEALSIRRALGDHASEARVLQNIGVVLLREEKTAEAEKNFHAALRTFREIGAKYEAAANLNEVGAMMFARGDLAASQKWYEQALSLFNELHDRSGTATTLTNIGEVLACRGQLTDAREMHEDSLAINREIGDKSGIAWDLSRIAEIFALHGELAAADARYQDALKLYEQIGDRIGAADTRVALAALAIDDGRASGAEKMARAAEEILRSEGSSDRSALALSVVSDALLATGKRTEALAAAEQAWKLVTDEVDRRIRFAVAASLARARAASKKPQDIASALELLTNAIAEASRTSFLASQLDLRLAFAEIEAAAGRPAAKNNLAALAKAAQAKAFGRTARRATAAAASL